MTRPICAESAVKPQPTNQPTNRFLAHVTGILNQSEKYVATLDTPSLVTVV